MRRQAGQARERRRRDVVLSAVSHELKTPVTALQLELQRLARSSPIHERHAPRLAAAARQAQRLASAIDVLVEVSVIDSGGLLLAPERLDLGDLVRAVVAHRAAWGGGHCPVRLEACDAVLGRWDGLHLERALRNVLRNAATWGRGRPIDVLVSSARGFASVEIRDRGPGFVPSRARRAFERFGGRDAAAEGLGLGLWLARQIVEAHGGRIRLTARPGYGGCVAVTLPLDPQRRGRSAAPRRRSARRWTRAAAAPTSRRSADPDRRRRGGPRSRR